MQHYEFKLCPETHPNWRPICRPNFRPNCHPSCAQIVARMADQIAAKFPLKWPPKCLPEFPQTLLPKMQPAQMVLSGGPHQASIHCKLKSFCCRMAQPVDFCRNAIYVFFGCIMGGILGGQLRGISGAHVGVTLRKIRATILGRTLRTQCCIKCRACVSGMPCFLDVVSNEGMDAVDKECIELLTKYVQRRRQKTKRNAITPDKNTHRQRLVSRKQRFTISGRTCSTEYA